MRWDAAAELRYDALIAEGAHRVPGARRLPTARAGIAAEDLTRRLAAWRGGADLPRTQLMHSFYIILHARSFSRSVPLIDYYPVPEEVFLDASHDSIHHPIHHPPSDSPSTIRSTTHTLLHLESYCGLGEWY